MGGQRRVVGRNCFRLCIIKLRCLKHSGECAAVPEAEEVGEGDEKEGGERGGKENDFIKGTLLIPAPLN